MKLVIEEDGALSTIHTPEIEELMPELGATIRSCIRLSNVEWEEVFGGWTIRSAKNQDLAVRIVGDKVCVSEIGAILSFATRQEALAVEERFAWKLK